MFPERAGKADHITISERTCTGLQDSRTGQHAELPDVWFHFHRHGNFSHIGKRGCSTSHGQHIGNSQYNIFQRQWHYPQRNAVFQCTQGIHPFAQVFFGEIGLENLFYMCGNRFQTVLLSAEIISYLDGSKKVSRRFGRKVTSQIDRDGDYHRRPADS